MAREVVSTVAAERRGQRRIEVERRQRLGELGEIVVIEAAVAADALSLQHVAAAVGEHGLGESPGLERHHREAFEI
jgi:hypothetical protein